MPVTISTWEEKGSERDLLPLNTDALARDFPPQLTANPVRHRLLKRFSEAVESRWASSR